MATWIVDGGDERLPDLWPGFVDLNDTVLEMVLDAAREACVAFAPKLPEGAPIPSSWIIAQTRHARELARAGLLDGDRMGQGDGGAATFPLDWNVKQLLRPKRGKPVAR